MDFKKFKNEMLEMVINANQQTNPDPDTNTGIKMLQEESIRNAKLMLNILEEYDKRK